MADPLLYVFGEFAESLRVAVWNEERIVTEALPAARRMRDVAFARTAENLRRAARRIAQRDGADETRRASCVVRPFEF